MATYPTSLTVLNRAAIELGLIPAPLANPFASADPNIIQLRYLLNSLGEQLAREHDWERLKATGIIVPVVGQTLYDVPVDFGRLVAETGWDRSSDQPFGGPLTSQVWAAAVATGLTAIIQPVFRIAGGKFEFLEVPTNTLHFEYVSEYWVIEDGEAELGAAATDESDDTLCFDVQLLISGLKLAFRQAKRLDATAEQNAYDRALAMALGNEGAAPLLSLAQSTRRSPPMPGLPWTGWGS